MEKSCKFVLLRTPLCETPISSRLQENTNDVVHQFGAMGMGQNSIHGVWLLTLDSSYDQVKWHSHARKMIPILALHVNDRK